MIGFKTFKKGFALCQLEKILISLRKNLVFNLINLYYIYKVF